MSSKKVFIVKANGDREPFSEFKLAKSLRRSGSSPRLTEQIVRHIKKGLRDGMKTRDIYSHAREMLSGKKEPLAARYSLKDGLMALGPSGHPFETFVGEVMKVLGYSVQIRQVLQGKCVSHEVDVVARKGQNHIMVETKFHNSHGYKSDIKVALYVKARYDDILKSASRKPHLHEAWLVTNTKFTKDAVTYGKCENMHLIGWNYPTGNSLQNIIERSQLTPITCLTTLSNSQKRSLIRRDMVLCRDLVRHEASLGNVGLGATDKSKVLAEANAVCKIS